MICGKCFKPLYDKSVFEIGKSNDSCYGDCSWEVTVKNDDKKIGYYAGTGKLYETLAESEKSYNELTFWEKVGAKFFKVRYFKPNVQDIQSYLQKRNNCKFN